MAKLKVLISGGGVAGNALAFWLSKLGHDVTVIERFPCLRATGLQIDLRGHGIEVLKRMGLEQEYRARSPREEGVQLVDKSGRRRAYFPANRSGKGLQSFTSDWEIMRGDLCQIIYEATKERASYIFGTSIESFDQKQKDNAVMVHFADGKTDQFDLVVGADGQGSRTRKMMLGSDTADGLHQIPGQYVAYFTVSRPIQNGEQYLATQYMAPGRRGIMVRRSHPDKIQVYMGITTESKRFESIRNGDAKGEKEIFAELMHGAGWQTEDLIQDMMSADDFYCERMSVVKLDSWFRGNVALVGDAAYCPSANTGMGTTSALVGAYILAGEIARQNGHSDITASRTGAVAAATGCNILTALKGYDQQFRPFMDQVQEGVLEDKAGMMIPSSALGIAVANLFFGIASLLRLNIFGWFLKEQVKNWDLPEYKELL
jgi:2-polyprenyl-6-methoxyphenol hydroxylase-like FAD-dependent oxidoreductase